MSILPTIRISLLARRAAAAVLLVLLLGAAGAQSAATDDERLQQRVREILAAVDGLSMLQVEAVAGVVTLTGEVGAESEAARALAIARNLDGVVAVNSRVRVSSRIGQRLTPIVNRFWARAQDLLSLLPLLFVAAAVLMVFVLLARLVANWDTPFRRLVKNPFLRDLARTVVGVAIFFVGVLIALEILDATALLGAALGTAGVLGLAVGFALRDTIENYIAAVLLSLRQPFAPHDHIALEGFEGQVIRLTSRATILLTFDGNHVRIPNAAVFKSTMVNYTRNHLRRFEFEVGVDSAVDLLAVRTLAVETLGAMSSVLDDPEPSAFVTKLGDSNVVVLIQGWVDQTQSSFAKVKSESIRLVKEAFDAAKFEMPEPIYRLRIESTSSPALSSAIEQAPSEPLARERARSALPSLEEDTAADHDIHRQVAEERMDGESEDLLSSDAPRE